MNVVDLITRNAATDPNRPAIIDGDRSISFGELPILINKTASHLRSLGIRAGDRLGISLKDNADHIIAILASARIGAAVVPVDWRARLAEKQHLAQTFSITALLNEAGAAAPDGVPCVPMDENWHISVAAASPLGEFSTDGHHIFLLNLSSGTTGKPKGAIVTHDDYRHRLARYPIAYGRGGRYRYLSVMPLCFSAGRNLLFYNLVIGSTVIMYPPLFGPEEYIEAVARYDITFGFLVPTAVRWLLSQPEQPKPLLPSLRVWGCGTAFLYPDEKLEAVRRIAPNIVLGYSASGAGGISTLGSHDLAAHADTVGRPYYSIELQIVDNQDQPLPTGETGRVRCQGPGVSRSYYGGQTDNAEEGIKGDWFYTGELGELDEAGFLTLRGRSSSLIVRGGANVYPEEVERVILGHDAIAEAAVIGRPSPVLGEEVVAAVVARRPVDQRDILSYCRKELSGYKIPTEIRVVPALPKTTSGKVKRAEVLAQFDPA